MGSGRAVLETLHSPKDSAVCERSLATNPSIAKAIGITPCSGKGGEMFDTARIFFPVLLAYAKLASHIAIFSQLLPSNF